MINWLSAYDYDYALAAIPIQVLLLFCYRIRRNLPIRRSRVFYTALFTTVLMTVVDIISCELNETWQETPLFLLYGVNIGYFLLFLLLNWTIFEYICEACRGYKILDNRSRLLASLPVLLVSLLVISTPWNHLIFSFGPDGYANGMLYNAIYICIYFYLFVSLIVILACFSRMPARTSFGLTTAILVMCLGMELRKVTYGHYLITCYTATVANLIVYISAQNPDLYRDQRIQMFNRSAFDMIGLDHLYRNETFHCIAIRVFNFETAVTIYGNQQVIDALKRLGDKMIKTFPDYYVFYFGSGNFILTRKGKASEQEEEAWKKRFDDLHRIAADKIDMELAVMVVPFDLMRDNIHQIEDLFQFIFARSFQENQRGNYYVNDEMLNILLRQKEVEKALTRAIENNSIQVYFQPIYSPKKDKIIGAEALARLIDPQLGYISPMEFIPIAERNAEIITLGRQIFEKVCNFIQDYKVLDYGIEFINVNLSPVQCLNSHLAKEFSQIAANSSISMSMIDFEITETSADDFLSIQRQMLLLQQEGAELSLDDFGTGTSNLTRLMNLPIHVVKIDRDVAVSYFNDEAPFLPDLIRMFQHANMKIVVEGVETEKMKEVLSEMGCDYLQGFYFAKALPPADFIDYMKQQQ